MHGGQASTWQFKSHGCPHALTLEHGKKLHSGGAVPQLMGGLNEVFPQVHVIG